MLKFGFVVVVLACLGVSNNAFAGVAEDCAKRSGDASIEACSQVIRKNPRDAGAYYNRGDTYRERGQDGDLARALADLNQAIKLEPSFGWSRVARAQTWQAMKEYDKSIADYDDVIRRLPKDTCIPCAYNGRGNVWLDKGERNKAIADYSEAIRRNPKDALFYRNRGAALEEIDIDRSLADYDTAIQLDPRNASSYRLQGKAYLSKGNLDRAIEAFSKAVDLDPKNDDSIYRLGFAYGQKGDLERAIASYTKAIELDPTWSGYYDKRGQSYEKKRDFDHALADFTKAIDLKPNNGDYYNFRCWLRATSNRDLQLALSDCDTALRLAPNDANKIDSRGLVHLRLNRLDEAIADYDAVLKLDPKMAGSLYGRGLAKLGKGDDAGATADINAAKAIRPAIADDFSRYGVVAANSSTSSRIINGISGLFGRSKPEEKSPSAAAEEKNRVATVVPPISATGKEASGKPGEQPPDAQSAPELPSFPGCNTMKPKTGHDEKSAVLFADKNSNAARSAARQALTASGWKIKTDQAVSGPDFSSFLLLVQVHSADIVVLCGPSKDAFVKQGREFEIFP